MSDSTTRYIRQTVLGDWGAEGQDRILRARVLLVGLGGLGGTVALYLATAGVGTLLLNDFDRVDETNLHRQLLFAESDIGRPKVEAAASLLYTRNHSLVIETFPLRLSQKELEASVATVDLVVDTSDNFATRDAVNLACLRLRRPLVSGACIRYEGQFAVFDFREPDSPCYTCLYPESDANGPLETCSVNGISGPVAGIIGSLEAQASLDLLLGHPSPWSGFLLTFDAVRGTFKRIRLSRDPDCRTCGHP
ncbi:MAG: HesA/MoeB/ThiF family protein [Gammaproteobacteria bacterium]